MSAALTWQRRREVHGVRLCGGRRNPADRALARADRALARADWALARDPGAAAGTPEVGGASLQPSQGQSYRRRTRGDTRGQAQAHPGTSRSRKGDGTGTRPTGGRSQVSERFPRGWHGTPTSPTQKSPHPNCKNRLHQNKPGILCPSELLAPPCPQCWWFLQMGQRLIQEGSKQLTNSTGSLSGGFTPITRPQLCSDQSAFTHRPSSRGKGHQSHPPISQMRMRRPGEIRPWSTEQVLRPRLEGRSPHIAAAPPLLLQSAVLTTVATAPLLGKAECLRCRSLIEGLIRLTRRVGHVSLGPFPQSSL